MKKHFLSSVALVFALAASNAAFAQEPAAVEQPSVAAPRALTHEIPTIDTSRRYQQAEEVNFVTGGIGDDERQAIEAAKASYNVHVTNASVNGAFVEDTSVVVRNKDGAELLSVDAGPLLYIQLPAGTYTLEATHNNETRKKKLVVGKKTKSLPVHLGWTVAERVSE